MKKYITIFLSTIFCFSYTGCDDKLDLGPLGQLSETSFLNNESDFEAGTYGIYSTLVTLTWNGDQNWTNATLLPDDDALPGFNVTSNTENFNWTSTNEGNAEHIWSTCYKGINRANVILSRLPGAGAFADPSRKAVFEGEAKFLRAYFNFLLATTYGNPPIVREVFTGGVETTKLGNSDPVELWDYIVQDLTQAQELLPPAQPGTPRVTKWSAAALLGKVYLYRAQWFNNTAFYANAITELNKVYGKYTLVPYGDNFRIDKENNAESVFEIQFAFNAATGDNTWLPTDFGTDIDQNVGSGASQRSSHFRPSCHLGNCAPLGNQRGYGNIHVSATLQSEFEANDPRRVETIFLNGDPYPYYGGIAGLISTVNYNSAWSYKGSTPAKYIKRDDGGVPTRDNATTNNERVIRYADVLLMLAEAKLLGNSDVPGAIALINEVRHRADPTDLILTPRVGADVDGTFALLMHERRVELAFEGHRYNDLVRWHKAGKINIKTDINFDNTTANNGWQTKHLTRPIPQSELDVNANLVQADPYAGG